MYFYLATSNEIGFAFSNLAVTSLSSSIMDETYLSCISTDPCESTASTFTHSETPLVK